MQQPLSNRRQCFARVEISLAEFCLFSCSIQDICGFTY